MDPVSSFGLAVNVITLIEFAGKLAKLAKKVHGAVEGTDQEINDTVISVERIKTSLNHLQPQGQLALQLQSGPQPSDPIDQNVLAISQDCQDIARSLVQRLDSLAAPRHASRGQKVVAGLKAIRELITHRYKDLEDRLDKYRQQLDSHVLLGMRKQLVQVCAQSDSMSTQMVALKSLCDKLLELSEGQGRYRTALDATLKRGSLVKFIRSSLYYKEIHDREDAITQVDEDSFSWIFQNDPTDDESPDDEPHEDHHPEFSVWLLSPSNGPTYWIAGIPGSGKSTLLRFLYEHRLTQSALNQWVEHSNSRVVVLRHYFVYSGTKLQQNREGMLRSLIYQFCQSEPAIQEDLFGEQIRNLDDNGPGLYQAGQEADWQRLLPSWTNSRLRVLLKQLHRYLAEQSIKLFVLIDGLDECAREEQPELIQDIRLLQGANGNVKCCLASRTWSIFHDEFGEGNMTSLHERTKSTITSFIAKTLFSHTLFCSLSKRKPDHTEQIIHALKDKANGSIIWAKVAMRGLLQGLTDRDTFDELMARLDELPEGLQSLYDVTLDRVPPKYRGDAAAILFLTKYVGPSIWVWTTVHGLVEFSLARDMARYGYRRVDASIGSLPKITPEWQHDLDRALQCRTGTLVACSGLDCGKPTFIHRTVSDYLESPRIQARYQDWLGDATWTPARAFAEASIWRPGRDDCSMHESLSFSMLRLSHVDNIEDRKELIDLLREKLDKLWNTKPEVAINYSLQTDEDIFSTCGRAYWLKDGVLYQNRDLTTSWDGPLCDQALHACELGRFLQSMNPQRMATVLLCWTVYRRLDANASIAETKACHEFPAIILTLALLLQVIVELHGKAYAPTAATADFYENMMKDGANPSLVVYKKWSPWVLFICKLTIFYDYGLAERHVFYKYGAKYPEDCDITLTNSTKTLVVPWANLAVAGDWGYRSDRLLDDE